MCGTGAVPFGASQGTFTSGVTMRPSGMTFGPDGNLYVADADNNRVLKFDGSTGVFQSVFVTSGNRPIQPIIAVRPGAAGDISLRGDEASNASVAWSRMRGGPYMPTPILYGGHLYTCSNSGVVACYEAATGKELLRRVNALPGFGQQKARIFVALLAKQLDVRPDGWEAAAGAYAEPGYRSVADVVDPESLQKVRDHKKEMKAAAKRS